jgi:hypothetical protein
MTILIDAGWLFFYINTNNLVPPLIDISEYIKTCTTYTDSDP